MAAGRSGFSFKVTSSKKFCSSSKLFGNASSLLPLKYRLVKNLFILSKPRGNVTSLFPSKFIKCRLGEWEKVCASKDSRWLWSSQTSNKAVFLRKRLSGTTCKRLWLNRTRSSLFIMRSDLAAILSILLLRKSKSRRRSNFAKCLYLIDVRLLFASESARRPLLRWNAYLRSDVMLLLRSERNRRRRPFRKVTNSTFWGWKPNVVTSMHVTKNRQLFLPIALLALIAGLQSFFSPLIKHLFS